MKAHYSVNQPHNFFAKKSWIFVGIGAGVLLTLAYVLISYFLNRSPSTILSPFVPGKPDNNQANLGDRQINPLTGEYVSAQDAQSWLGKRPLGVMVNNHINARPQSGLSQADIVYEIVAEGGITRYLAFFLGHSPEKVGPIRSTRDYYLILVKELGDAMIMHIGWSPQALDAINNWPVRSLGRLGLNCDQVLADPKGEHCWRNLSRVDQGVPWEHTAFGNIVRLRQAGEEAGWSGSRDLRVWQFKDESPVPAISDDCKVGECDPILIDFWYRGDYTGMFKYDRASNSYLRFTGFDENDQPIPTMDESAGTQVRVKNVIVQFASENPVEGDEKNRLSYQLDGSGRAYVFIDGKEIDATWSKASRDERTLFYDTNGQEIQFNRGSFWISIVSDANVDQVTF